MTTRREKREGRGRGQRVDIIVEKAERGEREEGF